MDNIKLRKALVHNINILKNCHIFDGNLPYTILYFSISQNTWSELTGLSSTKDSLRNIYVSNFK